MKTSAPNALNGTVDEVKDGAANTEVIVDIGDGEKIVAIVTRESARSLGLKVGDLATALIKAPDVILGVE